ncbi:hypothetical protein BV22DRAFT_309634 [Leucogyrophana mollusca]|uniref:Uncharacterized protein n=1 Tax=Leucogyrophana mollusca TaxID=85980 RepID=A0ACB8BQ57_9AGAM|nr:hypothetical protein BV22DRAFT_309634 [Leucogyrophana mollusca]
MRCGRRLQPFPNAAADNSALFDSINGLFESTAIIAGPRMVISLWAEEPRTREGTMKQELSTIQFDARQLTSQSVNWRRRVRSRGGL